MSLSRILLDCEPADFAARSKRRGVLFRRFCPRYQALAAYSLARAAAAQAQARQFGWAQAAAGYLDVYKGLLGC